MNLRIPFIAAALSLSACAHQGGANPGPVPDSGERGAAVSQLCFTRFLSGFEVAGDDRVIVRKGRRQYELQMFGSCPELRFAQQLGVRSLGNCLSRGDRILAYPYGVSRQDWRPPACIIGEIHEWLPRPAEESAGEAASNTPESEL